MNDMLRYMVFQAHDTMHPYWNAPGSYLIRIWYIDRWHVLLTPLSHSEVQELHHIRLMEYDGVQQVCLKFGDRAELIVPTRRMQDETQFYLDRGEIL